MERGQGERLQCRWDKRMYQETGRKGDMAAHLPCAIPNGLSTVAAAYVANRAGCGSTAWTRERYEFLGRCSNGVVWRCLPCMRGWQVTPQPRNMTFYFSGKICGDNKEPKPEATWPVCQTATNPLYSAGEGGLRVCWGRGGERTCLPDRNQLSL